MNKNELESHTDSVLSATAAQPDPKAQFCMLWSGTVKPALNLVKIITGPKVDAQIDKLIEAADAVCDGTSPQLGKFCMIWDQFNLKTLLQMVQLFTGPKVDMALNKFIYLAENMCEVEVKAA
ncbi:MAG: hypothetical protein INR69_18110 [Mucilaginibacter polytrichastri]|nr:hypothetical protein [Mucilaginibacter polytrichastri]